MTRPSTQEGSALKEGVVCCAVAALHAVQALTPSHSRSHTEGADLCAGLQWQAHASLQLGLATLTVDTRPRCCADV